MLRSPFHLQYIITSRTCCSDHLTHCDIPCRHIPTRYSSYIGVSVGPDASFESHVIRTGEEHEGYHDCIWLVPYVARQVDHLCTRLADLWSLFACNHDILHAAVSCHMLNLVRSLRRICTYQPYVDKTEHHRAPSCSLTPLTAPWCLVPCSPYPGDRDASAHPCQSRRPSV